MDFDQEITQKLSQRLRFLSFIIIIFFLVILVRLWDLQILRGDYFWRLSEGNRIKLQEISAPRGMIFDRNGVILADNTPSFDISYLRQGAEENEEVIFSLAEILNLDPSYIISKISTSNGLSYYKPIKIKEDVSRQELSLVEFNKLNLPNVIVEVFPKRNYPLSGAGAHIIGYLGEIGESELKLSEYSDYSLGDFIGRCGVEKVFERELRGKSGWLQFEVDVLGRKRSVLSSVSPLPGKNLYLTIDSDLQQYVDKLLGEKNGVVIAMNPNNGEILAFVSHPSFNPNLFSRGISLNDWIELKNNPHHPLTNKGIQGLYPPGSLFKIITAIAGLEEGKITPETTFYCRGYYRLGGREYKCWKKGGHGRLNLYDAIEQSCDSYFYWLGRLVGIDSLAYYAKLFNLGKKTGFILNEKPGLIPTKAWKEKKFNTPWQEGETLSVAIGQSFLLVTPLQMLVLISAIANGGEIYVPRLIKKIEDNQGNIEKEFKPNCISQVPISPNTIRVIRNSLLRVVQSPNGTGKVAQIEGLELAGKTGTAQVVGLSLNKKVSEVPYCLRDHAWFIAFAPFENPKISVVVLVEHGGFGSTAAGPIAREVIKYYLKKIGVF